MQHLQQIIKWFERFQLNQPGLPKLIKSPVAHAGSAAEQG